MRATPFTNNAAHFFDSELAKSGETLVLLNARHPPASRIALLDRLRSDAREFSEPHDEVGPLQATNRGPLSL